MIEDNYPLGFKISLHRKDMAIALELARQPWCRASRRGAGGDAGGRPHRSRPRRRRQLGARAERSASSPGCKDACYSSRARGDACTITNGVSSSP